MGILRDIWNTIIGKKNQDNRFERGSSIEEPKMELVYKKESPNVIGGYASGDTTPDSSKTCHYIQINNWCQPNFTPSNHGVCNLPVGVNGDDFFASKEILSKEEKTDSKFTNSNQLEKKKRSRNVIGQKKLAEIKDYLLTYGSINVLTCEQKFKVKSLQNFIWYLRKEGLKIKTEKVNLHNKLGQTVEVTNYILISQK